MNELDNELITCIQHEPNGARVEVSTDGEHYGTPVVVPQGYTIQERHQVISVCRKCGSLFVEKRK